MMSTIIGVQNCIASTHINHRIIATSSILHFFQLMQPLKKESKERAKLPMAVILYAAGDNEDIRCVCRKFGERVVFRSGQTLCQLLARVNEEYTVTGEKMQHVVPYPLQMQIRSTLEILNGDW